MGHPRRPADLRALYFALAAMMGRFHYLKVGLGLVLAFVGVKMILDELRALRRDVETLRNQSRGGN